jgi:gliding motility-associated-like protein
MSLRNFFILILWWLIPAGVFAQYQGDNNFMTVSEKEGCAPFTIQINHPACFTGAPVNCTVVYGSGKPSKSFLTGDTIMYARPGNFTMQIVVGSGAENDRIDLVVNPNIKPAFEAYTCSGNQVSVNVTNSNYENYIFSYSDGVQLTKDASITKNDIHVFPAPPPSTRTVTIRGRNDNAADNCADSTRTVLVTPALPPATIQQVAVLNATQVQLTHNATPSVQYRLVVATNNATGFQNLKTIYSPAVNSEVLPNLSPDVNYYCFRLDAFNPCTNAVAASSNIVCSANFDVAAQNNQNQLTWATATTGTSATGFTVIKNGTTLAPLPLAPLSYTDTDITCGTDYTYQLATNYPGGVSSISLAKTVTAISTDIPGVVENISAVVGSSEVALDWQQDPAFTAAEYTITKAVNGQYSPLATSTLLAFTDDAYDTNESTCYRISYEDLCGNKSLPSVDACPIRLTGNVANDNTINLSWSGYTGWKTGVDHYRVEKYDEQGNLLQTFDNLTTLTLLDDADDLVNQLFRYVVTAVPVDGTVNPSLSNTITLLKEPHLYYPTAFTPNSDKLNDNFKVFGQFISKFEMKIFNRWGELMFITDDLGAEGWDGTYKGTPMPEATYVFTAKLTDLAGRTFDRSGTVVLLRKK